MKKTKIILLSIIFLAFLFSYEHVPFSYAKYNSKLTDSISLNVVKPTYIIKFDNNGGSGSINDISVKYGDNGTLPTNTMTNTGFVFDSWNTDPNGSGTSYQDGATVSNLSSVDGDEITLYAQWVPSGGTSYTVIHEKMNLDGTTYTAYETETLYGEAGTVVTPSAKQYTGFEAPSEMPLTILSDGSSTLTYRYKRMQYRLVVRDYALLDDTVSTDNGYYYYGTVINLKYVGQTGVTFRQWSNNMTNTEISFELTEDTTIGPLYDADVAYFVNYDGYNNMFGLFNRSNYAYFKRYTNQITLQQVLAKSGVQLVSTSSTDSDYPSDSPVYAWIENNTLYWWSEVYKVYFHPDTERGFYGTGTSSHLVEIDLNGTSTELVKNFASWFRENRVLERILGKINTDGLEEHTFPSGYNPTTQGLNTQDLDSHIGMAFMFEECQKLAYIDTSEFNTSNCVDMKRMFGKCFAITTIDVSHFDVRKVVSFYWMFRRAEGLLEIDLTKWHTDSVTNIHGMFNTAKVMKTVTLGPNFDTSNVVNMAYMFANCNKLETIYAYSDFALDSIGNAATHEKIFQSDTKLIGGRGTEYTTPFNSSYINSARAKISRSGVSGYFTLSNDFVTYTITYDLSGGTTATANRTNYNVFTPTFTLVNPTKTGYTFNGWTGSNGNVPQSTITITSGTTGNKSYIANFSPISYTIHFDSNGGTGTMNDQVFYYDTAGTLHTNSYTKSGYRFVSWTTNSNGTGSRYYDGDSINNITTVDGDIITLYAQWEEDSPFVTVFTQTGACTFNANNGITGNDCADYAGEKIINTGVQVYNATNITKDFEISLTIDHFVQSEQTSGVNGQEALLNGKLEFQSKGYPGFTFRNDKGVVNSLQLSSNSPANTNDKSINSFAVGTITTLKMVRLRGKLYYSINGGPLIYMHDYYTEGIETFDVPITFGGSLQASATSTAGVYNYTPFRIIRGTLSNMYIKMGSMDTSNLRDITLDGNGGTTLNIKVTLGEQVGNLPTSTRDGYVFDGWYDAASGGNPIDPTTVVTSDDTYYAHWKLSAKNISFSPSSITLNNIGDTATVNITNASSIGETWTYSSNKTNVFTVNQNGVITAVGPGEAKLRATGDVSGQYKEMTITVKDLLRI